MALELNDAPTQAQVSSNEAKPMSGLAWRMKPGRYLLHSKPVHKLTQQAKTSQWSSIRGLYKCKFWACLTRLER